MQIPVTLQIFVSKKVCKQSKIHFVRIHNTFCSVLHCNHPDDQFLVYVLENVKNMQ